MKPTAICWTTFRHRLFGDKSLYVAVSDRGVCRVTWPSESFDTVRYWVERYFPGAALDEDLERLSPVLRQLEEYLDGKRMGFDIELDMRGTPFQRSVWEALTRIPYGATRTYSDIAAAISRPTAVRAVGAANGANPIPIIAPCHRVIGKNAELTGFRGGLAVKEKLLRLEGADGFKVRGHRRFDF